MAMVKSEEVNIMAYLCINGLGKECDGCMCCREFEEETKFEGICSKCGIDVYQNEDFMYLDGKLLCEDCLSIIEGCG